MNDIKLYERIPLGQFPIRILLDYGNSYDFPQHWHEHTELHYVFKGNCRLKYGEETLELGNGDLAVINGNELHRGMGGLCDYICLIIPPSFFEQNHAIFEKVIHDEYISELIERIHKLYLSGDGADLLEIRGNMCFLIAHLMRNYTVKRLGDTVYPGYVNKLNRVNETIKYMGSNYDKPLSTKTLAAAVHLSEGYFCQIFKEVTGKTAMEYLNHLRANKAERMLKKTEMTVTEIAYCCGFEDANYFSRMYKRIKGESPQSVRRTVGAKTKEEENG